MKKKTISKRKMRRDAWNLDDAFLNWLLPRLKVYLHDAKDIVDLLFYKFTYNDKLYTQLLLIKMMIHNILLAKIVADILPDATKEILLYQKKYIDLINEVLLIWKIVFHDMWW